MDVVCVFAQTRDAIKRSFLDEGKRSPKGEGRRNDGLNQICVDWVPYGSVFTGGLFTALESSAHSAGESRANS